MPEKDVFSHPILESVQVFDDETQENDPHSPPVGPTMPTPSPSVEKEAATIALTEDLSGKVDPFAEKLAKTEHGKRMLELFNLSMKYEGDVQRAMKELGYKNPNPTALVRSNTFKQVMDHYFPLELLAQKNLELLNHPDWHATNAALDRLHKLRGDFTVKVDVQVTSDKYRQLSDEELQRIVVEGEIVSDTSSSEVSPSHAPTPS